MMKPDLVCKVVRGRRRTAVGTLRYIRRGCDGLFGQLRLGGITDDIAIDAAALASRHEGHGAEVKHVVLSLRQRNDQLLQELAAQWVERFAPGRSWLAGIHGSHVHLAVENEGQDGKPLDFRKKEVYEMAQVGWTEIASPAKAKVSSATVRFVQQHEASLRGLEGYGDIARWAEKQVGAGAFGVGRRDRAGRLISIALGGVRVRLK